MLVSGEMNVIPFPASGAASGSRSDESRDESMPDYRGDDPREEMVVESLEQFIESREADVARCLRPAFSAQASRVLAELNDLIEIARRGEIR